MKNVGHHIEERERKAGWSGRAGRAFGGTEMSQLVNGEESEGPKREEGFSENEGNREGKPWECKENVFVRN